VQEPTGKQGNPEAPITSIATGVDEKEHGRTDQAAATEGVDHHADVVGITVEHIPDQHRAERDELPAQLARQEYREQRATQMLNAGKGPNADKQMPALVPGLVLGWEYPVREDPFRDENGR